jgi:hypothetical protein
LTDLKIVIAMILLNSHGQIKSHVQTVHDSTHIFKLHTFVNFFLKSALLINVIIVLNVTDNQ